jgi:prevent-host-death family protein
MLVVGLKVLREKLSEYVRRAARGETVLVSDRGRVVAEIVPPEDRRSAFVADASLAEAMRKGWITAPAITAEAPPPRAPVAPLKDLLAELDEDRGYR